MSRLLTSEVPHVVVHPQGDRSRLAVRPLSGLGGSGDVIAGDRIAEGRGEADEFCAEMSERYGLPVDLDPRFHRLGLRERTGDEIFYLAVLVGENSEVAVAQAQWFDVWDYRLASDQAYPTEEKAEAAAAAIAQRFGLHYRSDDSPSRNPGL